MKKLCLAIVAACSSVGLLADEAAFRTDINPALLYFQAYQLLPPLTAEDEKFLHDQERGWQGQPLDERFDEVTARFDDSFRLLHRARFAKVPCVWGYDLTDGPRAMLPGLAPAKRLALAARSRMVSHLARGDEEAAVRDLVATWYLARNLSKDRILISALVQDAMENILTYGIAEQYHRLSPESLRELTEAFGAAPPRGSIADCIQTERVSFAGYHVARLKELQERYPGDDEKVWQEFARLWKEVQAESDGDEANTASAVKRLAEATDRKPGRILELLDELNGYYEQAEALMRADFLQYQQQVKRFSETLEQSNNPFGTLLSVFGHVRGKEFSAFTRFAMVQAATAYRTDGEAGLLRVKDPLTGAPFEFSRAMVNGVDRGLRLQSKAELRGFPEVLIFVQEPGPSFRLDGPKAGSAE